MFIREYLELLTRQGQKLENYVSLKPILEWNNRHPLQHYSLSPKQPFAEELVGPKQNQLRV